jgi:sec-independent protein translocase protein TatB
VPTMRATREVHDAVHRTMRDPGAFDEPGLGDMADAAAMRALPPPPPVYKAPRKNWRLKRAAMPTWYKKQAGVRTNAQSGAARVARFRPRPRSGGAI